MDRENRGKLVRLIVVVGLILLFALVVWLAVLVFNSDVDRRNLKREDIKQWATEFCLEQGSESELSQGTFTRIYCRDGFMLTEYELKYGMGYYGNASDIIGVVRK